MGDFSRQVLNVLKRTAPEQGGVISGLNPSAYNASDPFPLWVIQIIIILAMAQFLLFFLSRIRQPRVIAEVIGGIFLGPTVMGRIPGFTNAIFPISGMPILTVTSTIGLVLFLFLIALEIDVRIVKRNLRKSSIVSVAGLVIPLGLGAALGTGIYHQFVDPTKVNQGEFLLFTAVAIGITAFPVLCRILTELQLLDTTVGVVVLSAGVGNDVVGWILLALCVAIINASSGLTALWVLLASVGYVVVFLFPGRWAYVWLARKTGSLEQGSPTPLMMTLTLVVVFVSAFYTDIIGVHPIFGGFIAGLIIPHENGYAISIVEKLEDLVVIIFLPIYFALSGLKTDLSSLDNGITWGYMVLISVVAFSSKFLACGAAALFTGFNWREAGAIGSLMSCKGLVELIVLNIGLQANVLDTRTFSMFVLHAIILTCMTTPLTLLFYPPKYRVGESEKKDGIWKLENGLNPNSLNIWSTDGVRSKFTLVLDKMEQLPAVMTLTQILQAPDQSSPSESSNENLDVKAKASVVSNFTSTNQTITIDALRLMELTARTSAVLRSHEADLLLYNDPIISVFKTFGLLNKFTVSASLSIVAHHEYPGVIADHASQHNSDMIIVPWSRGTISVEEDAHGDVQDVSRNPFDGIFHRTTTTAQDQTTAVVYSEFIRNVFLSSRKDVALFVDRGTSTAYAGETNQHLFMPFFGGPDDRLALEFLVQLCNNPTVSATVVRITARESLAGLHSIDETKVTVPSAALYNTVAGSDTIYAVQNTDTRLASDTADNIIWDRYLRSNNARNPYTTSAISRITFSSETSSTPLDTVQSLATKAGEHAHGRTLIVIVGRSRRMAIESHKVELKKIVEKSGSPIGSSASRTLGDVGASLVAAGTNASLLVMQAAISSF